MRALPIIVDLFVLLTVFAIVLFFAALGDSAPNPASNELAMIEATAIVSGPAGLTPASDVMNLHAELVDTDGNRVAGDIIEVPLSGLGERRFLVRNAPDGARLRLVIAHISAEAFARDTLLVRLKRVYPGTEISPPSNSRIGRASLISVGVSQ